MQTKSILGVIGALIPVLYLAGLLYYFLGVSGSIENANMIGLGPTMMGLGIIAVLFSIPLIVKVVRLFNGPRPPKSDGSDKPGGPGKPKSDSDDNFDADAAVARYLARQSAEAAARPQPVQGARETAPVRRAFGRK